MAEYTPRFNRTDQITFTASAPITAGQAVHITGGNTVAPATANSVKYSGVAAFDVTTGDLVTVVTPGRVQRLQAVGIIDAGDQVECASNGAVRKLTTGPRIGLAHTSTNGGLVEVRD